MITLPPVKRTLYVERLEMAAAPAAFEEAARSGLVKQELDYSKALVEAGKLVLGGDFEDPVHGGLALLKAATLAEARELSATRPFVRAGLVRSSVLEWQVRYESPL